VKFIEKRKKIDIKKKYQICIKLKKVAMKNEKNAIFAFLELVIGSDKKFNFVL